MLWELRKRALKYIPEWFKKVRLSILKARKEQIYSPDGNLKGRYVDMLIRDYIAFCLFPEPQLEILYAEIKKEKQRLFQENQGLIYKVMRRMRVNSDDWAEVYSCAVEGLFYAIDNWDGKHAFSTIAYINILAQVQSFYERHSRNSYLSIDRMVREGEEDTFEVFYGAEDKAEERVAVRAMLEKLSEEERKLVELVFYEGYTVKSAGSLLGIPYKKTHKLLKSALAELRKLAGGGNDKEQELCLLATSRD